MASFVLTNCVSPGLGSRDVFRRCFQVSPSACSSTSMAWPHSSHSTQSIMARNASVSASQEWSCEILSSFWNGESCIRLRAAQTQRRFAPQMSKSLPPVSRLFGPAIFEASKLRVLFLGQEDEKGQLQQPRIYTLTHSDTTAKITLAVAQEINKAQLMGWFSWLQRDEVLGEWRKTKGVMELHVHCHISGGNLLHDMTAKLRFHIFRKELPMVLEAILHGDRELFTKHPVLQNAPVWVYFHSSTEEYNRLECWGCLNEATKGAYASEIQQGAINEAMDEIARQKKKMPGSVCTPGPCDCCSTNAAVIPLSEYFRKLLSEGE